MPKSASLYLESLSLYSLGRYDDALACIDSMLTCEAVDDSIIDSAAIFFHAKSGHEKISITDTDANHQIKLFEPIISLADWFYVRNQHQQAEHAYRRALSIDPFCVHALNGLGALLSNRRCWTDSEGIFKRLLEINQENVNALNNLGLVFSQLGRNREAEVMYRRALVIRPSDGVILNNLAIVLLELGELQEAEHVFRRVITLKEDVSAAHQNLGYVLTLARRMDEACAAYRRSLDLDPENLGTKLSLATTLLALGEYEEGWQLLETRYNPIFGTQYCPQVPLSFPRWRGEPLSGKSLIIWPEQGYGDVIQFSRYVSLLKASGVTQLSIACQPALRRLFETLDGVDAIFPLDGKTSITQHDYWCYVMSLPNLLDTRIHSVPANIPYLFSVPELREKWKNNLPKAKHKIGLVWAGAGRKYELGENALDRRRSMNLHAFLPILRIPDVSFVSLQKGDDASMEINELPAGYRPFDPMNQVSDFAETAAIIDCLDLVITVDTSVAHLAGALNKPVWILSRFDSCWRWLNNRENSPWYPSARLFTQKKGQRMG